MWPATVTQNGFMVRGSHARTALVQQSRSLALPHDAVSQSALAGCELQRRDTPRRGHKALTIGATVRPVDQNCPSTSFLCRPSARRASLSYSSATLMSLHLDVSSSSDSAFLRVASARLRQCLASENSFFCFMRKTMQFLDQENATHALRKIP